MFIKSINENKLSLLFLALGFSVGQVAAAESSSLETVLKRESKSGKISAQIVNLTTTRELLNIEANRPLNPASSIKLFTTYSALSRLGVNYSFQTQIFKTEADGLCIKGGGDPSFVTEDLYVLVQALKRKGLKRFSGKITLDATVFDTELIPEDRTDQDSERAYNAPISGLNFNYNTITVFVNPSSRGQPALVSLDWPFPFVKIEGKVVTGDSTQITWDKKKNESMKNPLGDERINIGGKIATDGDEWHKPFRLRDPVRGFGLALTKMLVDQGVEGPLEPTLSEGTCLGQPFYTYSSRPLSQVVQLMNKYSNNFIADSLVKVLDHEVNGHSGTAEGGLVILRDILKTVGIDAHGAGRSLVSGSGLTLGNAFAASDFIKLLKRIVAEKVYLPEIFASIPIAGVDGTLKRKYVHSAVAEKLRGKTGTLNGVQSLVGVFPNAAGEWIAVAVIANGGQGIPEVELARFLGTL